MNVVVLQGRLARPATVRVLPSGDATVHLEVSTTGPGGRAETVPVVTLRPAGLGQLDAGARVVVVGRVQRRYFRAGGSLQSRTEVVAEVVLPAGQRRRAERARQAVVEVLAAAVDDPDLVAAPGPGAGAGRK